MYPHLTEMMSWAIAAKCFPLSMQSLHGLLWYASPPGAHVYADFHSFF